MVFKGLVFSKALYKVFLLLLASNESVTQSSFLSWSSKQTGSTVWPD